MTCVQCKRSQVSLKSLLILEVDWTQASHLRVEELRRVEHCLFLFARHLVEQVCVVRVVYQVKSAVCEEVLRHVFENATLFLLCAYPCRKRIAHQKDGEVLVQFEGGVLGVCHCNHEGALVNLIGYCHLRVARQVYAVDLVEQRDKFITSQTIVNRNDPDTRLFKELNVGSGHVAGHTLILSLADHIPILVICF